MTGFCCHFVLSFTWENINYKTKAERNRLAKGLVTEDFIHSKSRSWHRYMFQQQPHKNAACFPTYKTAFKSHVPLSCLYYNFIKVKNLLSLNRIYFFFFFLNFPFSSLNTLRNSSQYLLQSGQKNKNADFSFLKN